MTNTTSLSREWAMPAANTFSIPPIREVIKRHMTDGKWIDPFSNSNRIASITNDLDPQYGCDYQMDAIDFLGQFDAGSIDGVLFDPPYSPRQISECYKALGKSVNMATTQSSYWANLKAEIARIIAPGGIVLSFGWNSGGIGEDYGFRKREIQLVAHGGWHNDTICVAEVKHGTARRKVKPLGVIDFEDMMSTTELEKAQ